MAGGLTFNELAASVGASLVDAQGSLTEGVVEPPSRMALSDVTLELKVAVESGADGKLKVLPVSAEGVRSGALNVGALSSVTLRFAAFADDVPKAAPPPPSRPDFIKPAEAIDKVKSAVDLKRLERALGPFTFEAELIESKEAFIVTAKGRDGETVRETLIPARKG